MTATGTLPYEQFNEDGITSAEPNTAAIQVTRGDLPVKSISWQARLKTGTFGSQTIRPYGRVHPDADFVPLAAAVNLVASNDWTTVQIISNTPILELQFQSASMGGGEEAEVRGLAMN